MKSQTEKLRAEFDKGRKHAVFSATLKLGITALHQRCGELRAKGYPIARTLIAKRGRYVAQFSKDWSAA